MRNLKLVVLFLVAFQISVVTAKEKQKLDTVYGSELPFMKGVMVEIKSYDADTQTFEVASPEFTGEGESYVTPEGLKKGLHSLDLSRIKSDPQSIVGNQYKTDAEIPTLFPEEKAARSATAPKSKKFKSSKKR